MTQEPFADGVGDGEAEGEAEKQGDEDEDDEQCPPQTLVHLQSSFSTSRFTCSEGVVFSASMLCPNWSLMYSVVVSSNTSSASGR